VSRRIRVDLPSSVVFTAMLSCFAGADRLEAHSASDAYLTLTAEQSSTGAGSAIHGQWDIALRDLDFVLKLDDDGDGRLTWGEVRRHQAAIAQYAYRHITLDGGPGNACRIKPLRQLIDAHADGSYAALFFDALCARPAPTITLHYTLFFAIDPSHRAILVMHRGEAVATAVLSPQNATIELGR
jgi:hypothetical protein